MLTSVCSLPSFPMWQQPYTPMLTRRWPHCQAPLPPPPHLDLPHQPIRLGCLLYNSRRPWLWHFKPHMWLLHIYQIFPLPSALQVFLLYLSVETLTSYHFSNKDNCSLVRLPHHIYSPPRLKKDIAFHIPGKKNRVCPFRPKMNAWPKGRWS